MDDSQIKKKTNNQLYGRLGYMAKVCKDCDFDYCGGCDFASETAEIEHEIEIRKNA